jgi:hypothetical protein
VLDVRRLRRASLMRLHAQVWRTAWAAYRASFDDLLPRRRGEQDSDTPAQGGAAGGGEGAELKAEAGAQPHRPHALCGVDALRLFAPSCAAAAARAGAERARPVLRELYQTRAGAYRDGVREFVLGYREAFRDALLQARHTVGSARVAALRLTAARLCSALCAHPQEAARVQQEAAHARAHPQEAARADGEATTQAESAPPRQAVPPEAPPQQQQGAEPPRTPRSD